MGELTNYKTPEVHDFFKPEHLEALSKNVVDIVSFGVDQSINSTGVTVARLVSNPEQSLLSLKTYFYCIPAKDIKDVRDFIKVLVYDKKFHEERRLTDLEATKLKNAQTISGHVLDLLIEHDNGKLNGVGLEGLSMNTRSAGKNQSSNIYDLAGLNYLIRDRLTDWLEKSENEYQQFVNVFAPMTNKARLVKGGVDKTAMWERFAEHVGEDKEINEKKESYLYDIADSYSIARILVHDYIEEKFIPKVIKEVKEQPFKIIKRWKIDGFNFRFIQYNDETGRRAVLSSNSEEIPIKVMKSYPHKKLNDSLKEHLVELAKTMNEKEFSDHLTKKPKKKK